MIIPVVIGMIVPVVIGIVVPVVPVMVIGMVVPVVMMPVLPAPPVVPVYGFNAGHGYRLVKRLRIERERGRRT
jgi:hypothetical protein